jgi:hypothetical protein
MVHGPLLLVGQEMFHEFELDGLFAQPARGPMVFVFRVHNWVWHGVFVHNFW